MTLNPDRLKSACLVAMALGAFTAAALTQRRFPLPDEYGENPAGEASALEIHAGMSYADGREDEEDEGDDEKDQLNAHAEESHTTHERP